MKIHKTPVRERGTYKQYDENGHLLCAIKPGDHGITDVTIDLMHRMEDAEVRVNIKERRLPEYLVDAAKKARAEWIASFEEKYGYKPHKDDIPDFVHRSMVHIDAKIKTDEDMDTLGDKSCIATQMSVNPFEDEDESAAEYMRSLVMTGDFTEREREVYNLVFIQGMGKKETGEKLGIKPPRVTQVIANIMMKVGKDREMRRKFR